MKCNKNLQKDLKDQRHKDNNRQTEPAITTTSTVPPLTSILGTTVLNTQHVRGEPAPNQLSNIIRFNNLAKAVESLVDMISKNNESQITQRKSTDNKEYDNNHLA